VFLILSTGGRPDSELLQDHPAEGERDPIDLSKASSGNSHLTSSWGQAADALKWSE